MSIGGISIITQRVPGVESQGGTFGWEICIWGICMAKTDEAQSEMRRGECIAIPT